MIKVSSVCLGIDFGLIRCGLAVGDENDQYALPLETIPTKDVINFLMSFNQEQKIRFIVLGLPCDVRGLETKMSQEIDKFKNLLESYNFSVRLFDEGTSTRRAMGQMRALGIDSKKSKSKKDEVAAAIILQDYFDFMRSTRS